MSLQTPPPCRFFTNIHRYFATILTCFLLSSPYGLAQFANLNQGLIGYWPFDGSTNDVSGNSNHAILSNNCGYSEGIQDSCLLCYSNGSKPKYATVGHGPTITNLSNRVTFSAWVKYLGPNGSGSSPGRSSIITRYYPNQVFILDITESPSHLRLNLFTTAGFFSLSSTATFPTNVWVHVAATYNGTNAYLYTNGSQDCSLAVNGNLTGSPTTDVYIGSRGDGTSNYLWHGGGLDDIRIYNRALSALEIMALANAIPQVTISNLTNQQVFPIGDRIWGSAISSLGILNTRVVIRNSDGVTVFDQWANLEGSTQWWVTPTLPMGAYSIFSISTASNGFSNFSYPIPFTNHPFPRLTVTTKDRGGFPLQDGVVFGPSETGVDGLRTNNSQGSAVFFRIQAGLHLGITNLTPLRYGGLAVVTNFVMPFSDTELIWNLDKPNLIENSPPFIGKGSRFLFSRNDFLRIDLNHSPGLPSHATINLVSLGNGHRFTIFSAWIPGSQRSVEISPKPFSHLLNPGLWVIEIICRKSGTDESGNIFSRKLLLVAQ